MVSLARFCGGCGKLRVILPYIEFSVISLFLKCVLQDIIYKPGGCSTLYLDLLLGVMEVYCGTLLVTTKYSFEVQDSIHIPPHLIKLRSDRIRASHRDSFDSQVRDK